MSSTLSSSNEKAERRRMQNREAQRNHRKGLKQKLLAYDQFMKAFELAHTSRSLDDQIADSPVPPPPLPDLEDSISGLSPPSADHQALEPAMSSSISVTTQAASDADDHSSTSASEVHGLQALTSPYHFEMPLDAEYEEGHVQGSMGKEAKLLDSAESASYFVPTFDQHITSFSSVGRICSPLHDAVQKGDAEILALLLEHGADATMVDSSGSTPLHLASQLGNAEIVKSLLKQKDYMLTVAENANGLTPLRLAIQNGHAHIVKILLGAGIDANGAPNTW